jgi:hypothetical protein
MRIAVLRKNARGRFGPRDRQLIAAVGDGEFRLSDPPTSRSQW